jgi:hypothetical protein
VPNPIITIRNFFIAVQGLAPDNPLCKGWNALIALVLVYIAISVPLGLSFYRDSWRPLTSTYQARHAICPLPRTACELGKG